MRVTRIGRRLHMSPPPITRFVVSNDCCQGCRTLTSPIGWAGLACIRYSIHKARVTDLGNSIDPFPGCLFWTLRNGRHVVTEWGQRGPGRQCLLQGVFLALLLYTVLNVFFSRMISFTVVPSIGPPFEVTTTSFVYSTATMQILNALIAMGLRHCMSPQPVTLAQNLAQPATAAPLW